MLNPSLASVEKLSLMFDVPMEKQSYLFCYGMECFKDIIHHQVACKCVFVSNVLWIVCDHMLIYLDCWKYFSYFIRSGVSCNICRSVLLIGFNKKSRILGLNGHYAAR